MITTIHKEEIMRECLELYINWAPNVPTARGLGGLFMWARKYQGTVLHTHIKDGKLVVNLYINYNYRK